MSAPALRLGWRRVLWITPLLGLLDLDPLDRTLYVCSLWYAHTHAAHTHARTHTHTHTHTHACTHARTHTHTHARTHAHTHTHTHTRLS